MADNYIQLNNLIDPEVFADFVEKKMVDKGVFSALATSDTTLTGQAGSTLSFPSYTYIGSQCQLLQEGDKIAIDNIEQVREDVQVKQVAKGTAIYDWAVANGLGDAMGEASSQVAMALADYRDNDLKDAIDNNAKVLKFLVYGNSDFNADTIIDAEAVWGEDLNDKRFAYITNGTGLATLRKDEHYVNGSEIMTEQMIRGTVGQIWGANILPSNKCKNEAYLIKEGALRFVEKKGVNAETKREADYKRTGIFTDIMYAPYVYKPMDIIKIFRQDELISDVTFTASAVADGKTDIDLTNFLAVAPMNCKIVYKTGGTSAYTFARNTALSDWSDIGDGKGITATAGKHFGLAIVDGDNKPIAGYDVTLA